MNVLKTDRRFFRDAERAAEIHLAFDFDANVLERYAHRGGDELTRQLRASGERAEQEISGTGSGTGTTDTAVCLSFEDLLSDFNGARDRSVSLIAARF